MRTTRKRFAMLVLSTALSAAFAGLGVVFLIRPDTAQGITLAAAERVTPLATTVSDYLNPPTLKEAWEDFSHIRFREPSERIKENTLARYERAAVRELRTSMHDPASFSVERVQRGKLLALCITFRAANAFNAIRRGRALVLWSGIITESIFHTEGFEQQWNRHCVQPAAEARALEKLRLDIAVLRAERAHLARPERIEEIARKVGLPPR